MKIFMGSKSKRENTIIRMVYNNKRWRGIEEEIAHCVCQRNWKSIKSINVNGTKKKQ